MTKKTYKQSRQVWWHHPRFPLLFSKQKLLLECNMRNPQLGQLIDMLIPNLQVGILAAKWNPKGSLNGQQHLFQCLETTCKAICNIVDLQRPGHCWFAEGHQSLHLWKFQINVHKQILQLKADHPQCPKLGQQEYVKSPQLPKLSINQEI